MSTSTSASPLERFLRGTESNEFAAYEKEFANRINASIRRGFKYKRKEPSIVKQVSDLLKSLEDIPDIAGGSFNLRTRTMYIHGFRSMVQFNDLGGLARRELGDLAFVFSIVYRGMVYFQRLTINQVKKTDRDGTWHIDEKQLRLLSQFPPFTGAAGSYVGRYPHNLPNLSGCLGSYGLMDPGEFLFVGAQDFANLLGGRHEMKRPEVLGLGDVLDHPFTLPLPPAVGSGKSLDNYRFASNTVSFSSRFLRFGIGEVTFLPPGMWDNPQARYIKRDLAFASEASLKRGLEQSKDAWDVTKALGLPYFGSDAKGFEPPPGGDFPPDYVPGPGGTGVVKVTAVIEG